MRSHHSRMRGYHSMPMSIALGLFLASFVTVGLIVFFGGR